MKRQGGIEQDMRSRCSAGQRVRIKLSLRVVVIVYEMFQKMYIQF